MKIYNKQNRLSSGTTPPVIERVARPKVIDKIVNRPKQVFSKTLNKIQPIVPQPIPPPKVPIVPSKLCAIIGNAASIFEKKDGLLIDSFQTVIRINSAKIAKVDSQGKKTNIIFGHSGTVDYLPRGNRRTFEVVNVSTDIPDLLEYWTDRIRLETEHDIARPTTGFMAIVRMMQLNYEIELFGFDWYATPTHYSNTGPLQRHHPKWEKQIMDEILEKHNESVRNNTQG